MMRKDEMTRSERQEEVRRMKEEAALDEARPLRHYSTRQLKEELRLRKRGE